MSPGKRGEEPSGNWRVIATNRRARRDIEVEETLEAGVELVGSEVKSLRLGRVDMAMSYAGIEKGELFLFNLHIGEYQGTAYGHEPDRTRKLLIRRAELNRLIGRTSRRGMVLVPLKLYFSKRGWVKVELGLGKGRKGPDRREKLKKREAEREARRYV